jgi:hypothetical protein
MSVQLNDGRTETVNLGQQVFAATSMIESSTYLPQTSQLSLCTTRGDNVVLDLPAARELAPLNGRPTIYLDQNHWSTLTHTIYEPERVPNGDERAAATRLIELATARQVVLPMSLAHMSETCKQVDFEQRYRRALTITRLSAGWQLRDPLDLRRSELRQALIIRYKRSCLLLPAAVTLEPNAIQSRSSTSPPGVVDPDLPRSVQWIVHVLACIGGIVDSILDVEHLPVSPATGWATDFQEFSTFLKEDPTEKEMKRKRTHAKFIADLGQELSEEAYRAGITPENMSDWALNHSEEDLRYMPALGLFREVIHEKLCDGRLRWKPNDLVDMMYLTAAAGYCDLVVAERAHTAHISNGLRRQGRQGRVFVTLRGLVGQF